MINRILHSWSFHMKFMKLAETSFHKLRSSMLILIKISKTHLTSQNVALWDINIALCAIYLFIVTRIFHLWKMTYLTFNLHYSAMGWNFLMQFSAKRFSLAALSAYYKFNTEIVKTLSFDLQDIFWHSLTVKMYTPPSHPSEEISTFWCFQNFAK